MTDEASLALLHVRALWAAGRAWDAAIQDPGLDEAKGIAWIVVPFDTKQFMSKKVRGWNGAEGYVIGSVCADSHAARALA